MPRPDTTAASNPLAGHPAATRALIDRQLAMLTRLAEIGMEIAEAAGRRAAALADGGEAPADAPDPGLSFARAARAVRLTIALQSRLAGDLAALDRGDARARAAEAATRRDRIHRLVERAIEAAHVDGNDDEDEIERLSSHAWERLTDEDDADLIDRPLSELVARICQDLGLPPEGFAAAFADAPVEGGGEVAAFAPPSGEGDLAGPLPRFAARGRPAARARASPAPAG